MDCNSKFPQDDIRQHKNKAGRLDRSHANLLQAAIILSETMPFDPKDVRNVAVVLALGGIAGAAVIQSHHDEKRKSQAEKDDGELQFLPPCELSEGDQSQHWGIDPTAFGASEDTTFRLPWGTKWEQ